MKESEKTLEKNPAEGGRKIEDFIAEVGIAAEDVPLIESFFAFDKNLIIGDFHNYFQFYPDAHERSMGHLERQIAELEREIAKAPGSLSD